MTNKPELVLSGVRYAVYACRGFDLSVASNAVLFPTLEIPGSEFVVGSLHMVGDWSTATFEVIVSNDPKPELSFAKTHPNNATLWASGVTEGFSLEHLNVGVRVTAVEASKSVDVYLLLRP